MKIKHLSSAREPRTLPAMKGARGLLLLLGVLGATPAPRHLVSGQVYAYIEDGVRHYTSRPPRRGDGVSGLRTIRYSYMETCYACAARPGVDFTTLRLNTAAYQAEIAQAARDYGVE